MAIECQRMDGRRTGAARTGTEKVREGMGPSAFSLSRPSQTSLEKSEKSIGQA